MLRKREWELENGPIRKNGVFPPTTYFLENVIEVKNHLWIVDLMYQPPKCPYS